MNDRRAALGRMPAPDFIDHLYRTILFREPDEAGRRHWAGQLDRGMDRLDVLQAFLEGPEFAVLRNAVRFAPPGHFNSPYPSAATIEAHRGFDWNRGPLPAIDYREEEQLALLEKLAAHYPKLPFGDAPGPNARYGYVNPAYSYGDGITLFCMINHLQPRRIIEVGSGHSSCVMLDAAERLPRQAQVTFIEPYPALLKGLLRPGDLERHTLHPQNLQECPPSMFQALEANDILFIDSSHVSKLGSDVHYLMFELLPALRPGVWVHIHDIFHPFEYPIQWYDEGRAWNETYVVRAFLQYNDAWQIEHFSSFMVARHEQWYRQHMPLVLRLRGGNIWISKRR